MHAILPFTAADLPALAALQPEQWSPLQPHFELYLANDFAWPVKCAHEGRLAGVSDTNRFGPSAWLAHVVVHPEMRGRGIASSLVAHLMERLDSLGVATVSLIATDLGYPVYRRQGFADETEYGFFEPGPAGAGSCPIPDRSVRPARTDEHPAILELDRQTCGEDRSALLGPNLAGAWICERGGRCLGFWLPAMGEGLVAARDADAGRELLKLRMREGRKITLPLANGPAVAQLLAAGWRETRRSWRMRRGPALDWRPDWLYSRIGGNFG
jgi:GNAT superfamily N-acetyltransferase